MLIIFQSIAKRRFVHVATIRLRLVAMALVNIVAFAAASTIKGEEGFEGFIRGSQRLVTHEPDGQRKVVKLDFVMACDRDCCLTGRNISRPEQPKFEPIEQFNLAMKGNEFVIGITVDRREGDALTTNGRWSAKHIQEFRNFRLDDSFESRFEVVTQGSISSLALPVYLSWHTVGVTKDTMLAALRGENYRGANELGSLEISGNQGIGRIHLKKSKLNLHSPGYIPLSKLSEPAFPNGLESMEEEYSFTPERKLGMHETFRCVGALTQTGPDGRSRKTEIETQIDEHADAKAARKFINALLEKIPNNKKIITDSGVDIATVLDNGKQKVVVDRDVEGMTETRFNNKGPSFYYYAIVLFVLVILGVIGYVRWSQKAS